jgi:hypothetical protein
VLGSVTFFHVHVCGLTLADRVDVVVEATKQQYVRLPGSEAQCATRRFVSSSTKNTRKAYQHTHCTHSLGVCTTSAPVVPLSSGVTTTSTTTLSSGEIGAGVTVGIIVLVAAVGAVVFARRRMSTMSGRGRAVDLQLNPLHATPGDTNEGSGDALDTLLRRHSASVYEGD